MKIKSSTSPIHFFRTIAAFALVGALLVGMADAHAMSNASVYAPTVGAFAGAALATVGKFFHLI